MRSSILLPRAVRKNKGISKAAVGAIVGGVFVGLFLIIAVVYYLLKRRKRKRRSLKRPVPRVEEPALESAVPLAIIMTEEENPGARLGREYSHTRREGEAPIENGITGKDMEESGSRVPGGRLDPRE
jgi:hypothetical protein